MRIIRKIEYKRNGCGLIDTLPSTGFSRLPPAQIDFPTQREGHLLYKPRLLRRRIKLWKNWLSTEKPNKIATREHWGFGYDVPFSEAPGGIKSPTERPISGATKGAPGRERQTQKQRNRHDGPWKKVEGLRMDHQRTFHGKLSCL
jgi:hypothetical protein